jgi:hypothetical protein
MRTAALALVLLIVAAGSASAALANGDPPSDVLLSADVYPPTEPASPALVQALKAAAQRAKSAGYPSKVAVVQSEIDLGTLVQAFNKPQQYADYLASDLRNHPDSVSSDFALLVVMPAQAGIAGKAFDGGERKAARTINVRSGATSNELVRAATATLEKMAAAGGHPIGGAGGSAGGGGSSAGVVIGVLGGLLLLTAVAVLAARARRRAEPPL